MAGHERHFGEIGYIPGADDQPAAIGIGFDLMDQILYLINHHTICTLPATPLFAVNRTQFAICIGPLVPDTDSVFLEIANIGFSLQKPKQFMDNAFRMHLFSGNQWKSFGEIEAHLIAKNTDGTGSGTIGFLCSVIQNVLQ